MPPAGQPEPFSADVIGQQDPVCCHVLGLADPGNQARRVARPQRVDAGRVGGTGDGDPDPPALGTDLDSDRQGPGSVSGRRDIVEGLWQGVLLSDSGHGQGTEVTGIRDRAGVK
ncbi:MAG: hypothetical protein OXD33_00695 [Rhodobacteraceae bacterium]|nr:hypothetical protein [Paracoccaceae bacterium]